MAFQKKTWVNRVAQYPLRRLLTVVRNFDATNTAVMDIQREEGEVTTEGDAFSAENMNDLENRIKQGFDDAGGGNFVGVRYHTSLVDYPDYPCWEDMTAEEKAKYDISTGATINFLDDEAIPDDILGNTDISGIGDGTLTGAISDVDERVSEVNNALSGISDYSLSEKVIGKWVDGSTLYEKTINFGQLPNTTTKNVAHGIVNLKRIIYANGMAYRSTDGLNTPVPSPQASATNQLLLGVNSTNVSITTYVDRSMYGECYITLQYTKTS